MERHDNIKDCVLYTYFGKFNTNVVTEYRGPISTTWESSAPCAQHQNGIMEWHMRTVVEGARGEIDDPNLPL